MDYDKMNLDFDSEESKKSADDFIRRMEEQERLEESRMEKLGIYLQTHSFSDLMTRIILKNGKDYQDRCWKNGYLPCPTHTLMFVMDYANRHGLTVDEVPGKEHKGEYYETIDFFGGYYFFNISFHTGVTKIYDKDCNLLLHI